ncbi:MAG: replication factor C large subunit [Euryarchaeota archaeon]|nr:replication factor C large subunit [Euryarchaeota archaeon]
METWVEKYRPRRVKDIAGNITSKKEIMDWIDQWKAGVPGKRALLLYGPPGTGKSSAAHAIANELNYDRIELNASDSRTQAVMHRVVGAATSSGTLAPSSRRRIIIIDEVDGIHGTKDRGGMAALKKLIDESRQPILLIANDPYRLDRGFRSKTLMVQFKKINKRTIFRVLKEISAREGIRADEKALNIIATNAAGDLRSAINDLQAVAEGKATLKISDVAGLKMRDAEVRIFDTLVRILKTESLERAREAVWDAGEDPDTLLKWLVENVALEYERPEELALAYDRLSRADVFMGRIMRRQDWTLLGYATDLMGPGVALAKEKKYVKFQRYRPPQTFAAFARTRKDRNLMEAFAGKFARKCFGSRRRFSREFAPFFDVLMNHPEMGARIASELELEREEVALFARDAVVDRVMERAEEITAERLRRQAGQEKQASLLEFE